MKNKLNNLWQIIKGYKFSINDLKKLKDNTLFFSTFLFLLLITLSIEILSPLGRIKFIQEKFKSPLKKLESFYEKAVGFFDTAEPDTISSSALITLALRHLKAKRTRTIITIGGMAIGIGAIVLLLSLGYGFQRLVVSRVARLDEMKQADVAIGQASSLSLNESALNSFKEIEYVEHVLPLVSLVSKVSFNNSVSDVVAYGVTSEFLNQSAINTIHGKMFESSDDLSLVDHDQQGMVAGYSIEVRTDAKLKKEVYEINYSLEPLVWKPVYQEPSQDSDIIGYTKRTVGDQEAVEVWGDSYPEADPSLAGIDAYGNQYDRWVKNSFPIWEKESCVEEDPDCFGNEYLLSKVGTNQLVTDGYLTEDRLIIERFSILDNGLSEPSEGAFIEQVQFHLGEKWVQTYLHPKNSEVLLGLFTQSENGGDLVEGDLVWGESYADDEGRGNMGQNENNQWLGYWIRAELPLWRKVDCQDCDNYYLVERDEAEEQITRSVYFPANLVEVENLPEFNQGQVLGEATGSAEVNLDEILKMIDSESSGSAEASATSELFAELGWVEIASAAGVVEKDPTSIDQVPLTDDAQKLAVVNQAMLRLLGIEEGKAVGESILATLVFDNSLFSQEEYQAESVEEEFKIIGVVPGNDTPAFYFPFSDLKGTGIENFTQMKVVAVDKDDLKEVRVAIESMGFKTSSVVDTVGKINGLFNNIRLVLFFLGLIALGVAALGMFNTLTVSLLEKTREVGLMKAMGMKSDEVKRLFLAESIVIGLSGGLAGLALGFVLGKLISASLSTVAVAKGVGVIDVVFIPPHLAISIIVLSLVVGVFTGIFPARRTTKISALNALRYE